MRRLLLLPLLLVLFAAPLPGVASATAQDGSPEDEIVAAAQRFTTSLPGVATGPLVTPGRETEPVILTGADFPSWAAPADITAKAQDPGGAQCVGTGQSCTHSTYEDPDVSTQAVVGAEGAPVDRLVAYRWTAQGGYVQIPFQVDEMFTRYLSNNASGFSFYSLVDQHTTYAFDREGFRWTASHDDNACLAAPASDVAADPVPGLDTSDELVFMARDAGARAPAEAALPAGVESAYEVAVVDPHRPDSQGFVYVALAAEDGPRRAFDADNGYVRYERDADADVFLYSQSSYGDYGNAPKGAWFDPATGTCVTDNPRQRRPGDQATVTTPRYRFRYDGRWMMTELEVSADQNGDWTYGPDLIDRWKARAFQQRPGGETPCCGYEEEENNWGGSSILMGERAGPVRVIRETWGADSGTNVVRRETFYRDEIRQKSYLRVHPIPPLDGIYAQWDHNATAVTTYFNPHVPDGVPIDGRNDEVFGNNYLHVSQEGVLVDGGDDATAELIRDINGGTPLTIGDPEPGRCSDCVSNDIDTTDPLFSGANALLAWEQIAGPHGTLVTRWSSEDVTPGGAAHAPFALPYYRDDACFDDGTGSNPGPHLRRRGTDDGEYAFWTEIVDDEPVTRPRECWDAEQHDTDEAYAAYLGSERFYQGSVGTHGMHLLLIADSDNAGQTVPLTEINAENRMVVLPPTLDNVGERYGRGFEKPLVATAVPLDPGAPSEEAAGPEEAAEVAEEAAEEAPADAWPAQAEAATPDVPLPEPLLSEVAAVVPALAVAVPDLASLPSLAHELAVPDVLTVAQAAADHARVEDAPLDVEAESAAEPQSAPRADVAPATVTTRAPLFPAQPAVKTTAVSRDHTPARPPAAPASPAVGLPELGMALASLAGGLGGAVALAMLLLFGATQVHRRVMAARLR